jgi:hypothetical protein
MKRIIFSLILLFCLTASLPAMAADIDYARQLDANDQNAGMPEDVAPAPDNAVAPDQPANGDILSGWDENGYPDDIGGVFYDQDTGKTTILLVNPSVERENELTALMPGVAFLPSAYSYNELLAVQKDITNEMISQPAGEAVIYSAGIGFTMIDGQLTGFGESGKEFRVVVSVDESVYAETVNRYRELYGDMVYVEPGTAPIADGLLDTTAHARTNMYWPFALIAVILFAAVIAFAMNRRRYSYALQTANGGAVTVSEQMTRKQIKEAVKESALLPSDAVYERIQRDVGID